MYTGRESFPLGLLGYKLTVRGCPDPVAQNRDKTHVSSEATREEARLRAKYSPCCRDAMAPAWAEGRSIPELHIYMGNDCALDLSYCHLELKEAPDTSSHVC